MKTKVVKVIILALVLMVALCVSSCSRKEESKTQTAQAGFTPRLDASTQGKVTIVGHYSNFEALEAEFNLFNKYYPNVELNYTYLDNYNGIIVTALSSAEAPDIFFTYPWMVYQEKYASIYDTAVDLADPALGIDLSCIRSSLIYTDENGKVPTVPVYTTTYGMMVNETIFEKEGIAVPKTYSELVSACEKLKKAGYENPIMAYNRGNFLLFPLYFPYFCAQIQGNQSALSDLNAMNQGAGKYMRSSLELAADFMSRGFVNLEDCNKLENDYNAVIMRFFQGDVPMMLASGNTVSGTEKRESQSEAFTANPFRYSFQPVPSTEQGGYFLNSISLGFAINGNSANLEMAKEFMRFLVNADELNRMAKAKRMVTPCNEMALDDIYAAFGQLDASHVINQSELGLDDAPDQQVRKAGWQVSNGNMTVDEAVSAFGTLK